MTLTWSLHCWVILLRRTFDPNLINIFQRVQEIWSEHKIQGSNLWPLTVTLTLSRHACVMGSAHRLTKANIWLKFHENLSKGSGDMERTRDGWPSIVTLTLSLHRWFIGSTHHLTKANIWPKFNKAVWMAMEQPQNSRLKLVTFNCDLDLESVQLSYGFCTSSQWGKHLTNV